MKSIQRLEALDVFRGLTIMLMILVNTPGSYEHTYAMIAHAPWAGCTLADLVFPFFLFSVGFSGFLSCRKHGGTLSSELLKKIVKRVFVLFVLGIIFNIFPGFPDIAPIRIFGVLQRIALAYGLGIILCLLLKSSKCILLGIAVLLLLHTLGLYLYAPNAPFDKLHNLSQTIDLVFPGAYHIYQGFGLPFDPEGIYGTISAATSVMLGYLAGKFINQQEQSATRIALFTLYGLLMIGGGLFLSLWIPICKALWTASYVFLTSGLAFVITGYFLHVLTHKNGTSKFYRPFKAFGTNPIFFFFISAIIAVALAKPWIIIDGLPFYGWFYKECLLPILSPNAASLVFSLFYLVLCWIIAEILYRRDIIIKI